MFIKSRMISTLTLVMVSALSTSAWAATTVCKVIGNGTNKATIAVASNYYLSAQLMVAKFQATTAGADSTITVCQNSTAHLLAEIQNGTELPADAFASDPGYPRYDYFFAANTAAPLALASTGTTYAPFTYAKGIPTLYAYKTILSESQMISPAPPANHQIAVADLSGYTINTPITLSGGSLALAGVGAPYGVMSYKVLNAMQPLRAAILANGTASGLPATVPSWVHSPLYDNIDLTFSAVTNTGALPKAGVVAYSQLIDNLANVKSTASYVKFTNASYLLTQNAVQLKNTTLVNALSTYINGQISSGAWATWIKTRGYVYP